MSARQQEHQIRTGLLKKRSSQRFLQTVDRTLELSVEEVKILSEFLEFLHQLDNALSDNERAEQLQKNESQNFLQTGDRKIELTTAEGKSLSAFLNFFRQRDLPLPSPDEYITAREAADILNISPVYLIGLLEKGEIPFIEIDNSPKIQTRDVLAYREIRDNQRREQLRAFSAGLEEDGLYDLDYDSVQEILNAPEDGARVTS